MAVESLQPADLSQSAIREASVDRFVWWAIAQLRLETQHRGDGLIDLVVPESQRAAFDGRSCLRLNLDGPAPVGEQAAESAAPHDSPPPESQPPESQPPESQPPESLPTESLCIDGTVFQWLCQLLREQGLAAHSRPANQPMSVHELARRLFPAYRIQEGSAHLSGCTLEDRPFLRLTYLGQCGGEPGELIHYFFAPDGSPVSEQQITALGLNELVPSGQPHPKIDPAQLELLVAAGERNVAREHPLAASVVWVKYVTGRLQLTIQDTSEVVAFEGWASTLQPPPFVCPHSGLRTFDVAATDDGRIVAAESIARCDVSGRRVVKSELVQCSVTGRLVTSEFVETCPVADKPALQDQLVVCQTCRQKVSRTVLSQGVCLACRSLAPVDKDDPRLVWLLAEYPGLDRLRKWKLAETASVYLAQSGSFWRRLLVVVDRETLSILHMATRGRLAKHWIPLEGPQREALLR